jgi:DNA helicase-2/ATP-dependent DNA helicase PcrA
MVAMDTKPITEVSEKFAEFDKRYKNLNPEQREAVDALKGPVMVIAGPGTGKTTVLTLRIANILKEATAKGAATKNEPERILALTFTESGAVEMRRKLAELVGQEAYRVEISTFHGFANRIIQDYPDHFPDVVGATPVTEVDQVSIMREVIDSSGTNGAGLDSFKLAKLRPFGDTYFYLKDILRAIAELKQQGVSPDEFARIAEEDKEKFYANPDLYNTSGKYEGKMKGKYDSGAKRVEKNLELVHVYGAYQSLLRRARGYDYADMIMYVAIALEKSEDLRRVLQDAYEYFLVDEHQDTNDAQNKIIEMLADGDHGADAKGNDIGPNLFVVGDEKQAIFRFQGASLENFHYFKNRYKNVKLISLRSNYRSTQAILDAAQGVSPRDTQLVAKAGHKEHAANLAVLSTIDSEYYFIATKIKEIIKSGTTGDGKHILPEEIAVLYRDNRDAAPLARVLEKLKVPFNIESDQDVLGDLEIKKLVRVLRAVQHFGNDVWLAEALHVDFLGIPPMDAYRLMAFAGRRHAANAAMARFKLYDVLHSEQLLTEAGVTSAASKKAAMAFAEHLSEWKRATENAGAAEAFEAIVRDSGFLAAVLAHPHGAEKLAKLHALFDLLKSFVERKKDYTLKDFFGYLDLMQEHGVAVRSKDTVRLPGRVRLMTAHKSKGLEFDYVFIMNAVDRKWGSRFKREKLTLPKGIYKALAAAAQEAARVVEAAEAEIQDGDDDDNADERNVFYVALTRARKEVFITMSKADREGKELLPTQFIAELKEEVLTPYDTAPYEAEFAKHRDEIDFGREEGVSSKEDKKKTPDLEDKEFLNALFEAQGISVTALNNYLECPWAYFYRNLVRIPEAPNKNLSFGNAVHAALKSWFDEYDAGKDLGADYLVRRFEEALAHEPITESEYEEALAKGRKALPAFFEAYHLDWTRNAMNEVRVAGVAIADGTPINGKLDRIEFLEGENVRVIDYKTGKPKTRNDIEGNTQSSDGNYKRQLVFYKLLLDKEEKYAMNEGVIQFIEPDDRGKPHRESFDITHGEVAVLEKQVETVAGEIRSLAFWDKGCHKPDCRYCELREGMGLTNI